VRQVSAALRAAIDAGERVITQTFTVDWDNDGVQDIDDLSHKAQQVSVNQSLESSLPLQVRAVPGVAVAELTASLGRGNTARYTVPATYRSLTTSSALATTTTPTWAIAKPTTAKVGDVILVAIFTPAPGVSSVMGAWRPLLDANVPWTYMSIRGDGTTNATRLEGLLLSRRVTVSEPDNYTITLPLGSQVAWISAAVNVGEQNLMGITDFTQKGEDNTQSPTSIVLPQVKVDVPGSTIISFFGAASYAVSGIAFSPLDSRDVEQIETTITPSARPATRMAVLTHSNASQGLYQKGVTFTGSTGTQDVATIGFAIVLAPKLAGDETQHAAWTFSELNANSPYAGKSRLRRRVQWALKFVTANGFESVPLFTGLSTAPSASSNRQAVITALDNREIMRNTGWGADLAAEYPTSLDTYTGLSLPTMPGLESTWMVSRLFFLAYYRPRLNFTGVFTYDSQYPTTTGLGFFPSPLAHRTVSVWAPLHGSAHPLQGYIIYAYTDLSGRALRRRCAFEVGPFVAATKNHGTGSQTNISWSFGNYQAWNQANRQLVGRLQCWVKRNYSTSTFKMELPDNGLPTVNTAWVEILSTGVVRFRVEASGVSRTITGPTISDFSWHFLGVHFNSVTGSVTFRVDTTNTVVAMSTWSNAAIVFILPSVNLTLVDGMQCAEFQLDGGYDYSGAQIGIQVTDAWANENFTPSAYIDKSENILDVIPYIDPNDDTFKLVSDIAAAEFAAFFFDEDGFPHYRTSRSDASATGQTVQRQLTSRKSLRDISYESGVLQVRNIVNVGYTPYAASINVDLFTASGTLLVKPGSPLVYTFTIQGPLYFGPNVTYTAYQYPAGTGDNLTSLVNVTVQEKDVGNFTVTVTNNAGTAAYLVDNTGKPNLHVTGSYFTPLQGNFAPVTYSDSDSIREFGEQPLQSDATSVWIQRSDSAATVALKLLSDLCQPHPVITGLTIKGDPTLQFGDMTTIVDPNGLGVNGQYRITTKNPQFNTNDGFTQALTVREAPAIAVWDTNFWDDGTVWG
jgi:hypothetical protein